MNIHPNTKRRSKSQTDQISIKNNGRSKGTKVDYLAGTLSFGP